MVAKNMKIKVSLNWQGGVNNLYYKNFRNNSFEEFKEYDFSYEQAKKYHNLRCNKSQTLVLHPDDPTTDFLYKIYEGKGYDVVNDSFVGTDTVAELIQNHQRIIALGHGTPSGLLGGVGFIIDDTHVDIHKNKDVVAVWCHANQYMEKHGINGLFSGMFISEEIEADFYGINASYEQIQQSNMRFANSLSKYLDDEDVLEKVKTEYNKKGDPVVEYNIARLFNK